VLHCVLRELFEEHDALTMVHVTGETTEFGIVENGTFIESVSVPYGLNTIVRSLMSVHEQTAKEIHSLLELFHAQNLAPLQNEEVSQALNQYATMLKTALEEHANIRRFPKQAFILAPASFTELFRSVLDPILKEELGVTSDILTINSDVLGTTGTHDKADMSTQITSRFFHKLHGCGEIDSE
jgi:hypothetical protein